MEITRESISPRYLLTEHAGKELKYLQAMYSLPLQLELEL